MQKYNNYLFDWMISILIEFKNNIYYKPHAVRPLWLNKNASTIGNSADIDDRDWSKKTSEAGWSSDGGRSVPQLPMWREDGVLCTECLQERHSGHHHHHLHFADPTGTKWKYCRLTSASDAYRAKNDRLEVNNQQKNKQKFLWMPEEQDRNIRLPVSCESRQK